MAGAGKRLRPHTLTTAKPLVQVAGKPIVQHLVEDLAQMISEPIEHIAFVTGRFGASVEEHLIAVAREAGATGSIHYQDEPLGTAHAILCAEEHLSGKVLIAFADTLFRAEFQLDTSQDGVMYVSQIDDPSQFGVVTLNAAGAIEHYVEKPKEFVSDLAMIGIYYLRNGEELRDNLRYLINNNINKGGEFQLPDALRRLTEHGRKLMTGRVSHWMDCGNSEALLDTNQKVLTFKKDEILKARNTISLKNSVILEPCFIGDNVTIENSVVGPFASIGNDTSIHNSRVDDAIIQTHAVVNNAIINHSIIGNYTSVTPQKPRYNLGDYNTVSA